MPAVHAYTYMFINVLQNDQVPEEHKENVVNHIVHVHLSVGNYSLEFAQKLRRVNHVTPKNYLDFINRYAVLIKQKDKMVLDQVSDMQA